MEFWCACIILAVVTLEASAASWGYTGGHGPYHWKDMTNSKCDGSKQSPIDILTRNTEGSTCLVDFSFYNFDKTITKATISNNGHTAQVTLNSEVYVEGGGLSGRYKPLQFHFHWGSDESLGSEHTMDGKRYPLEMHLVTMKEHYGTLDSALTQSDGFAVLGFFFEVSSSVNSGFNSVINKLASIVNPDTSTQMTPFKFTDFLPSDLKAYYRYDGSLTTPNCNEVVVWTLFNETIKISSSQLAKFRALYSHDKVGSTHEHLVNNFRPIQSLSYRKVFFSLGVPVASTSNSPTGAVGTTRTFSSGSSGVSLSLLSLIATFLISCLIHIC